MRGDVTDSGIMRVLSKICDIVCLNVLWLVCSLPIITIGASTTALYTVMLKLVKNEEGYIFKGFLHAFKLNLSKVQSYGLYCFCAEAFVLLITEYRK